MWKMSFQLKTERKTGETNPGLQGWKPQLHVLQPLCQSSDLISELTLPLSHGVLLPPETTEEPSVECERSVEVMAKN